MSLDESIINQHIRPLFSKSLQNTPAIYLANHSLGRMLDETETDVLEGLQHWTCGREDAWDHWFAEMQSFREQTAALIHAESADCIIPKSSAGQGLRAVLNCYDEPIKVLISADEFNSIDFILKVFSQRKRIQLERIKPERNNDYQMDDFLNALQDSPKLIVLSMVLFTTGQLITNLKTLIDAAHHQGVLILLDLYHA
ncbi:MAG: aminotransferase class V-fold PLP-dependent enzyme, partial [Thiotrichaceae bacterium]